MALFKMTVAFPELFPTNTLEVARFKLVASIAFEST